MRALRYCVVLVCVVSFVAGAWAQAPAAKPAVVVLPKAEPVLSHVPAGTLGFVVINNLQSSTANLEVFLRKIGLAEMAGLQETPGVLLDMLQGGAGLGEGFNPNGGLAVVMLDPQQFDVDLPAMMGGPSAATAPTTAPARQPKLPLVVFVPGTSIEEVFGNYELGEAEGCTTIMLPPGPMAARMLGGYVLLSPNPKALDAVIEAEKKAAAELNDKQLELLGSSNIAFHVNMKVAGPIIIKMFKAIEGQLGRQMAAQASMKDLMSFYMSFYRDMISQTDSATVTGRFVETGLVFEEVVAFSPESTFGKAMAITEASGRPLLDHLPNLPYVLAAGGAGQAPADEARKLTNDMLEKVLESALLAKLPEETKVLIRKIFTVSNEQVQGSQLVIGGAPEGSGLFGLAYVIQCKDAEVVKALSADECIAANEVIKALVESEETRKLSIEYVKDAELVGDIPVDAITIRHTKIEEMSPEDRAELSTLLGDQDVRIRVAAPDENTVVVTFGGAKAFLAEALKTAGKGGGTILTGEGVAEAMKYMPKNPTSLTLLNIGNLFEVIANGTKVMKPDAPPLPFNITCKTPIAIGGGVAGPGAHATMYIPNELIAEAVEAIVQSISGPKPPSATTQESVPGGEDF